FAALLDVFTRAFDRIAAGKRAEYADQQQRRQQRYQNPLDHDGSPWGHMPSNWTRHRRRGSPANQSRRPLAASNTCACSACGAMAMRSPGLAAERPCVTTVSDTPPTLTTSSVSAPIGSTTMTSAAMP